MSGGHFQYQQFRIEDIAQGIDDLIETNDEQSLNDWGARKGKNYPPEIIEKFMEAAITLRRAAKMANRIDYLVSGDDDKSSFIVRWNKEVDGKTN